MITIIVAVAENNGIGFGNKLLVHLPGDLKRFKKITMGHSLIMGKKTWDSLPNKPLSGRKNIVLTDDKNDTFDGAVAVHSINDALSHCDADKEVFIIGGGSIYRQFLPLANRLYVTHIHKEISADTFFPVIDPEEWNVVEEETHTVEGEDALRFTYTTYLRRKRQ